MAEYCSICFKEGKSTFYEFNLYKIAKDLKKGHSISILCEGCRRRAIYKDEKGKLHVAIDNGEELVWEETSLDQLEVLKPVWSRLFFRDLNLN